MRWFKFFAHGEQGAHTAPEPILVPPGQRALVIRDGVAGEVIQEGPHPAPSGPGSLEIRLLAPGVRTRAGTDLPPGGADALPFSRSWLLRDGSVVGMVVQPGHSQDHGNDRLSDWQ